MRLFVSVVRSMSTGSSAERRMYIFEPCETARGQSEQTSILEEWKRGREIAETENMNGTFLPEPSDSLPISGALVSILRPRFLLSFVLARGASSSVVRGIARRQLDELHAKRSTQNFLRLFKHGFERAPL